MIDRKEFYFMSKVFFTSESVTSGHPDKVCDSIADHILDAALAQELRDDVWLIACGSEVLWIPEGVCRARYAEKYSLRQNSSRALVLEMSY